MEFGKPGKSEKKGSSRGINMLLKFGRHPVGHQLATSYKNKAPREDYY
jgi:hypothetical protein